jgi:hypothetical protein
MSVVGAGCTGHPPTPTHPAFLPKGKEQVVPTSWLFNIPNVPYPSSTSSITSQNSLHRPINVDLGASDLLARTSILSRGLAVAFLSTVNHTSVPGSTIGTTLPTTRRSR